jgi:hypothetical protein
MRDMACDPEAIAADAVPLAELPGGTGRERVRIDWLNKRLAAAPGGRHAVATGVNAIAARASATVEWRATDQAALDRQEAELAEILD